jgi:hypothetical protein
MLIAATSLVASSTNNNDGGGGGTCDTPESYSSLVEMCVGGGAVTSPQVHRRVSCVVATSCAVLGNTQRVRKARKLSIPVVSVAWLRDSLQAGVPLPFDTYGLLPSRSAREEAERVDKPAAGARFDRSLGDGSVGKEKVSSHKTEASESLREVVVELGCCCACHDGHDGVGGASEDCPWCVDCAAGGRTE